MVRLVEHDGNERAAASGYLHAGYAASMSDAGTPRRLAHSEGWVVHRRIPGSESSDAMGCYPLFCCRDWSRLPADIAEMEHGPVSLTVVSDPFGGYTEADLRRCFRDLVVPFKDHFIVDLGGSLDAFVDSHHRRNARKAADRVAVERCDDPGQVLDEWCGLYSHLIDRHAIRGLSAFSRAAFAAQLRVPGIVVFRASLDGRSIGMNLWYLHGDTGYYHLGAYDEDGYRLNASFALFERAIKEFSDQGVRALDLGAGAGRVSDPTDGLSRFKRGWSTRTQTAYLCGRVLDPVRYHALSEARGFADATYFPAYRAAEGR